MDLLENHNHHNPCFDQTTKDLEADLSTSRNRLKNCGHVQAYLGARRVLHCRSHHKKANKAIQLQNGGVYKTY